MSKISNAIKWIWCVEKPIQASSKTEWLTRAIFVGSLRPTESKADLGRLVFWYGVGLAVMYRKYEKNYLDSEQQMSIEEFSVALREGTVTYLDDMGLDPIEDIEVPRVTKLEFIERPGLYGNVDPDVTRYTLCYETDDLDEAGIVAQVSRREFEALRDKIDTWVLAQTTVEEIKAAVVSTLSEMTAQRQPGF